MHWSEISLQYKLSFFVRNGYVANLSIQSMRIHVCKTYYENNVEWISTSILICCSLLPIMHAKQYMSTVWCEDPIPDLLLFTPYDGWDHIQNATEPSQNASHVASSHFLGLWFLLNLQWFHICANHENLGWLHYVMPGQICLLRESGSVLIVKKLLALGLLCSPASGDTCIDLLLTLNGWFSLKKNGPELREFSWRGASPRTPLWTALNMWLSDTCMISDCSWSEAWFI